MRKKLHYFILDADFSLTQLELTDPSLIHQIGRVLRIGRDEEFVLCNGKGGSYIARIISYSTGKIILALDPRSSVPQPKQNICCVSLIRKERFEWLLEKIVEVGVTDIVPMVAARTKHMPFRRERFEKIIKESVETTERMFLPILHDPLSFEGVLNNVGAGEGESATLKYLFDPSGEEFEGVEKHDGSVSYIGPEGGFSDEELQMAQEKKVKIVNLGRNILRTETAAILACYALDKRTSGE